MEHDIYRTIEDPSAEILYKEKNSKFFGYAFPVTDESEVKFHLENLRKQHRGAVHFCYAWQIGAENPHTRANDDGEPGNSAGMPILGQIQSFKLTNVLVVIVRFFGGVKLGVGGLMSAYKTAAQMALTQAAVIEKHIMAGFKITFEYKDMSRVMRIVREKKAEVVSLDNEAKSILVIAVRKSQSKNFAEAFEPLHEVKIEKI